MKDDFDYRSLRLVHAPCALCGRLDFETLVRGDRYAFGLTTAACRTCGLIQTHPRPDAGDLEAFYRLHYRWYYQDTAAPDSLYVQKFGKSERLRYTARLLLDTFGSDAGAALLDCGCGEGSLFAALRAEGFKGPMIGIEPNPTFASYALQQGALAVYPSMDAAIDAGVVASHIVLIHVLEHFADPVAALLQLTRLATPDAQIYVDVPDVERYHSINDLHLAHLYHFDRRTLRALLAKGGWSADVAISHTPPHHPDSLRTVGKRATQSEEYPPAALAQKSGQAVRDLRRHVLAHAVRQAIGRVPGVRMLWRAMRARSTP